MMRLAWLTDLHLNFLGSQEVTQFLDNIIEDNPDAILITGDIAEAHSLAGYLTRMAEHLQRPIYFVLGNHDYYRGSVRTVRDMMIDLTAENEWLTWMSGADIVELTPTVALIGHDGWGDGRIGNYDSSPLVLNDFFLIEELAGLNKRGLLKRLNNFGDESADHFEATLTRALKHYTHVILLTHVPPFAGAAWHQGKLSDADYQPFYVNHVAGEKLRTIMAAHPRQDLLVLCGHTHGNGQAQVSENIHVLTGGAEYGAPEIQRVFDLGKSKPPQTRPLDPRP